jgi:hypothetical protein
MNAIVPLNVTALRVSKNDSDQIVSGFKGRTAVFEKIPYGSGANIASTGDTVVNPLESGASPANPLGIGVHIHWELPDYFRKGAQPSTGGNVTFPQTPNRWLVIRYFSLFDANTGQYGPVSPKVFIIESDFLSPTILKDAYGIPRPAVSVPLSTSSQFGAQPFLYMGRVLNYENWNPTTENPAQFLPAFQGSDGKPLYLTSIGFVGPSFASYYPDCQSVFGFWDNFADMPSVYQAITTNQPPIQFRVSYQVTGWINDNAVQQDPLTNAIQTVTSEYDKYVQDCHEQGTGVVRTPTDFFLDFAGGRFRWLFQPSDITYTLNPDKTLQQLNAPERTLVSGIVQEVVWNALGSSPVYFLKTNKKTSPVVWTDIVEVAVGNTTIEALSALLKYDMGDPTNDPDLLKNYEYLLDALQLGLLNGLESQSHKIVTLEDALHGRAFSQVSGGLLWTIQPPPSKPGEAPDPDQDITLPLDLAEQLNLLNDAQRTYDQGRSALDAMRKQLFMDWIRWVKLYVSNTTDPNIPTNAIAAFLSSTSGGELGAVTTHGAKVGILQYDTDPESGQFIAPIQPPSTDSFAHAVWAQFQVVVTELEKYPGWTMESAPASPFFLPPDPVLLLEGSRMEPVRRNGAQTEIAVRVSADLLSAISLDYSGAAFSIATSSLAGIPAITPVTPMQSDVQSLAAEGFLLIPMLAGAAGTALQAQGGSNNPAVANLASFVLTLQSAQGGASPLEGNPAPGLFAAIRKDGYQPAPNPQQDVTSPQAIAFTFTNSTNNGFAPNSVGWNAQQALPEFTPTRVDPFSPLSLIWSVTFAPLQWNNGRSYTADNLTAYFELDDDAVDYSYIMNGTVPIVFTSPYPVTYTSSVVLSKKPTYSLRQQIEEYKKNYPDDPIDPVLDKIEKVYEQRKFLSQGISGFSGLQTLRVFIPQITVEDLPRGPRDVITLQINSAASSTANDNWYDFGFNSVAPIATGLPAQYNFGPLRSGFLNIKALEIVDVFGQLMTLSTNSSGAIEPIAAITVQPRPNDAEHKGQIFLPPRLLAPTRLWFRWLSARFDSNVGGISSDFVNASPATSPVCGWIVPNHLDNSLFFYDADGAAIGSFGIEHDDNVYRTRAGNLKNPGSHLEIDIGPPGSPRVNPHTAGFLWYVWAQSAGFMTDLMGAILSSETFIHPANFAEDDSLAVLIGRPLAITRAGLGFESSGNVLPISQADVAPNDPFPSDIRAGLYRYFDRQQASSANLAGVQLPVRLGEAANTDDGVVGYLIEAAGPSPYSVIYSPFAPPDGQNKVILPTPTTIQATLNANPMALTLLVDPRSPVHATTGVLPVAQLQIPADQYSRAMNNLAMTFFTTPVLAESDGLAIALPQESGYAWFWINPGEDPPIPLPSNAVNENSAYGYSPQTLLEGWLQLRPLPKKE